MVGNLRPASPSRESAVRRGARTPHKDQSASLTPIAPTGAPNATRADQTRTAFDAMRSIRMSRSPVARGVTRSRKSIAHAVGSGVNHNKNNGAARAKPKQRHTLSCPSWARTRTLLIQSQAGNALNSGNLQSNREFASSAAGVNDWICRVLPALTHTETHTLDSKHHWRYSACSARAGSTRLARHAGRYAAIAATTSRIAQALTSDTGSAVPAGERSAGVSLGAVRRGQRLSPSWTPGDHGAPVDAIIQ
jgi:hypothetical protein